MPVVVPALAAAGSWIAANSGALMAGAAVVASGVGTGLSFYSQQQQASNAQAMADYNYKVQQQNAKVNNQIALQQAEINRRAAMSQYQAGVNNVQTYYDQAAATEARGQEEARRMRAENERFKAVQRAKYAKSGVTTEGSPLLVMAETAGTLELGVQDALYQSKMDAAALRRTGDVEKYQAGFSLMDAGVQEYQAAAARAGYSLNMEQARLNRAAGYSQAAGLRTSSYGTLISGIGQTAGMAANYAGSIPTTKTASTVKPSSYGGSLATKAYTGIK